MNRKLVLTTVLVTILIGILGLSSRLQRVEASGTIYIRANGLVEGTDKIVTADNITYTFTGNINDSIVIERNNIVVDGTGYTAQGNGNGIGIYLLNRSNVTVKNMEIRTFERAIELVDSSNNTISANNVTNNEYGIVLYDSSSENTLRDNYVSNNKYNLGIFTALISGYIQDIDSSNTVNGKPVYYWINKRDMAVPLDAGYVVLVNCTGITVKNLNLTNNMQGVALSFTTNSVIVNNSIMNNFDGIRFDHSSNNNVISGNNITANTCYGIRLFFDFSDQLYCPSCNNTIYGNDITGNESGIRLDYPSNNAVSANNVANNSDGIGLYGTSRSNTVSGNNITNSTYGIWFYSSYGSRIYHNNFINNINTVYPSFAGNFWDAGYPSGGNYWGSMYHGRDIYCGSYQNETGSDGIGDAPYVQDNYPLMGMFNSFGTALDYDVNIISNSTISNFLLGIQADPLEPGFNVTSIIFYVTGENGTAGFCRICIPRALLNGTYKVFVNGTEVSYNLLPCSNETYSYLYFNYTHSKEEVIIIPEFPSFLILPLFMIATLLAVIVYKRK